VAAGELGTRIILAVVMIIQGSEMRDMTVQRSAQRASTQLIQPIVSIEISLGFELRQIKCQKNHRTMFH
jgi:hypothetical protein